MKPQPMDSRFPPAERAMVLILTLLDGVEFAPHQIQFISQRIADVTGGKSRLSRPPGRPRTTHCARQHERTPENTGAGGKCLSCVRITSKKRAPKACAGCTHATGLHRPECYHRGADGKYDCPCTRKA